MLLDIFQFLLNVLVGFFAGLCLLRAYLGWLRVPLSAQSGNPIGPLILNLTNWWVLRWRKVLPIQSRLDWASCVAAYLMVLAKFVVVAAMGLAPLTPKLLLWALFDAVSLVLSGLFGLMVLAIVWSWVQSHSPMAHLIERMSTPLLAPIRRWLPLIGGLDLSPMVFLVLLQVLDIVLRSLRWSL